MSGLVIYFSLLNSNEFSVKAELNGTPEQKTKVIQILQQIKGTIFFNSQNLDIMSYCLNIFKNAHCRSKI